MSFNDQSEQRSVAELLRRSLQRGRLAHAYLFAGPRGSGKEAMARTLAKALNCTGQEHDCCDRCDSCARIEKGTHPDVYWLKPESKSRRILVDQIRDFEKSINLKPSRARVKVGVIVDAECLNEQASNAFLKTLEEPPAQTVIVLLSAEPQRLLATILSRCLRISFGPTTGGVESPYRARLLPLLESFTTRAGKIAPTYQLLANITAILAQLREEARARIEAETDLARYKELEAPARERLEEEMEARIEGETRAAREQLLEDIYGWFSDVMLCVAGAEPSLLAHPDSADAARRCATGLTYEQASANLEAIDQIREALSRNVSEPLVLEVGLLKLTA